MGAVEQPAERGFQDHLDDHEQDVHAESVSSAARPRRICDRIRRMKSRVLILGAGFGGLELATILSDALADEIDVTLIDKGDSFVFGYSKLDVMFRGATPETVRLPYEEFVKPGVRLLRETVTAIDPEAKRVTTDAGTHEAESLVVALGADYDMAATPGLAESGDEFYSFEGAVRMRDAIRAFTRAAS